MEVPFHTEQARQASVTLKTNDIKQMKHSWQVKFGTQEDDYRFGADL